MNSDNPRVGVIGLGAIGGGVAVSLANHGIVPTAVYDVRADATINLAGVPPVSQSPAAVATLCDVIVVAVVSAAQAKDVLTAGDGILTAAGTGSIVVLLSTVSVEAVQELAAICEQHGVQLLDAGVTNGGQASQNGLVTMVGGPAEVVDQCLPVLAGFSAEVIHCGPLGSGMTTKLARNMAAYGMWAVVREAASIAAAGGVSPDCFLEVMRAGDAVAPTLHLELLASGYKIPEERAAAAVEVAEKDFAAAQELAGSLGVEVPMADLARPRMKNVFGGDLDGPMPEDRHERGRAMMDRAYGSGFSQSITDRALQSPSVESTLEYLFAEIWARPYLSLRDRRLVTLGATAMLGRADLLEIQLRGALAAGELTDDQLREIALHLHHYAGWGNGTALLQATEKLVAERARGK